MFAYVRMQSARGVATTISVRKVRRDAALLPMQARAHGDSDTGVRAAALTPPLKSHRDDCEYLADTSRVNSTVLDKEPFSIRIDPF